MPPLLLLSLSLSLAAAGFSDGSERRETKTRGRERRSARRRRRQEPERETRAAAAAAASAEALCCPVALSPSRFARLSSTRSCRFFSLSLLLSSLAHSPNNLASPCNLYPGSGSSALLRCDDGGSGCDDESLLLLLLLHLLPFSRVSSAPSCALSLSLLPRFPTHTRTHRETLSASERASERQAGTLSRVTLAQSSTPVNQRERLSSPFTSPGACCRRTQTAAAAVT